MSVKAWSCLSEGVLTIIRGEISSEEGFGVNPHAQEESHQDHSHSSNPENFGLSSSLWVVEVDFIAWRARKKRQTHVHFG